MTRLRLATRKSALALWQTEHVAARLRAAHPGLTVELVPMTTRGDRILDRPLAEIGGKGLFLKELEEAMLAGEADAAVHSLKDVPMDLEGPFALPAILERADPFDAFVSAKHPDIDALPKGARVGTSSLRRQAQLRARRADLVCEDLRGNVNTRLKKLEEGEYDAILLACAGLERLDLGHRIRSRLEPPDWLPAVGQGAIGIECRDDARDVHALVAPLAHAETATCVAAERSMNRRLQGGCDVPIAGYARLALGRLKLDGMVGDIRAGANVRASAEGGAGDAETLGLEVAELLLVRGGADLLADRG
jgi:hydroxymethylbilane synthase